MTWHADISMAGLYLKTNIGLASLLECIGTKIGLLQNMPAPQYLSSSVRRYSHCPAPNHSTCCIHCKFGKWENSLFLQKSKIFQTYTG